MKKAFCETCREKVEYNVKKEKRETIIKGKVVKFKELKPFCKKCHSEIFVSKIRDINLKELEKAYNNK